MSLIKPKQISKLIAGRLYATAFTTTAPDPAVLTLANFNATSVLTALVVGAGDNGVDVPVQSHMDGATRQEGFVDTGSNVVEVFGASDQKLTDSGGNEIYGRLTSGAYAYDADRLITKGDFDSRLTNASIPGWISVNDKASLYAYVAVMKADLETMYPLPRTASAQAQIDSAQEVIDAMDPVNADGTKTAQDLKDTIDAAVLNLANPGPTQFNVAFYVNDGGAETAFTFDDTYKDGAGALELNMVYPYVFTFEHLPADFATSLKATYVNDDPAGASSGEKTEQVTITATNVADPITYVYKTGTNAVMYVNGQIVKSLEGGFTIDSVTGLITWLPLVVGFNLDTADSVYITYESTGALV